MTGETMRQEAPHVVLSTPGRDRAGIPEVDAAYLRYAEPRVWIS